MSRSIQSGHGQRDSYWDNVKFALIVLVVIGHFVEPYMGYGDSDYYWPQYVWCIIYTFHMPAFVFVSGLFCKSAINGERFRIERVISFLLLYVIYKVIRAFLLLFLYGDGINFELLDLFVEPGVPWYLLAMAAFMVLTFAVKDIRPAFVLPVSVILAFLVGFSNDNPNTLAFFRIVTFWPFFLLGYYLNRKRLESVLNKKWLRIIGCFVFALFLLFVWKKLDVYSTIALFTGKNNYATISSFWEAFHPLYRFLYYPFVIIVGVSFLSIIPRKKCGVISVWGSRTLQVYFLHRLILYIYAYLGMYEWLVSDISEEKYWTLALIIISLLLAIVLSMKIWSRPFDWIMKQKYPYIFQKEKE